MLKNVSVNKHFLMGLDGVESLTGSHKYDRPSQVWQALKGIQQLRVKHAFHLLSTKRYWPYPRAQSKWSDGIQVVSSIHTDQDWYTIYISCVTH